MIILMKLMDKMFDVESTDKYGKVVSWFKWTVSREIKGFNKVLNSFKIIDIKSEVLDVGLEAVMLAYDDQTRLYWIHNDLWGHIEFEVLPFLLYLSLLSVFCILKNLCMMLYVHQSIVHI
uniref:Uncharacterized protein n=1 Tax=Sipha flava TaxID=143950 RepID=A0A2S2QYZ2_9HEMI